MGAQRQSAGMPTPARGVLEGAKWRLRVVAARARVLMQLDAQDMPLT